MDVHMTHRPPPSPPQMKAVMEGKLGDEQIREKAGEAEVKAVFAARNGKKAAGCLVVAGHLVAPAFIEVLRKKKIVFSGQVCRRCFWTWTYPSAMDGEWVG